MIETVGVFDVVLVAPEIATNTGAVVRLCANAGARLHLVRPLGFSLDSAALKRGGLDYHELADVRAWDSWEECRAALQGRILATTARGETRYDSVAFESGDALVFGREADGLPGDVLRTLPPECRLHIPMHAGNRSLNLANAVSVVLYEAWRQHDFTGAANRATWQERFPEV